jgi:hypothetical protein
MTHIEQGHYRGKHSDETKADEKVAEAIKAAASDERISCAKAEAIAKKLGVTMEVVGLNNDLLEIKAVKCQLGLFGYGPSKGVHSILKPPETVPADLEAAIRGGLDRDRLPCNTAWEIAEQFKISKKAVCEAADALSIKSTGCQLGVF